jgi:hypothetical protein
MAKLEIKSFEAHRMSHCPEVPVFKVHVTLVGSSLLSTVVLVSYEPMNTEEPEWNYMYSVNEVFDELDMKWKYQPTEQILSYARNVIQQSDAFKNWKVTVEEETDDDETVPVQPEEQPL